jgi:hypothetical protein
VARIVLQPIDNDPRKGGSSMLMPIVLIGTAALVLGIASVPLWRAFRRFRRERAAFLVTCPRTGEPAAIEVEGRHRAWTVLGARELRMRDCSRWPVRETAGCGEECLRQVEAAPEECLVLTILSHWFEKKSCAVCGRPLGATQWLERMPVLLDPEGTTLRWDAVPPERLQEVLRTHRAVCYPCHVTESFRREHPELLRDRPPTHGPAGGVFPLL